MQDSEMLELYWQRDETAIAATKSAYGGRLRRLAHGILKNDADAEECENDTYLKAWENIPPGRPDHFYAYLAKICRNIALHRYDWASAAKRNADVVALTAELEQCIPGGLASRDVSDEDIGALLGTFLKGLPEEHRTVFVRRYFLGESISEVARFFALSESKTKSILFRVRNKLRIYLENEGIEL